jgi:O-antigen/teichoic acid export membrane protein/peptidoglycan/xylan/chitin deacetylase (PgdA/CDA1 family)
MMGRLLRLGRWLHAGTSVVLLLAASAQILTFVFLGRGLGVHDFGRLMVLQAISQLAIVVVSLGAGEVLVRRLARDYKQHGPALGHGIIMTIGTALVVGAIMFGIVRFFEPTIAVAVLCTYILGELLGNRLGTLAEYAFIGHFKIRYANGVRLFMCVSRLVAVVVAFRQFELVGLSNWLVVQGMTTFLAGVACLALVIARLGRPSKAFHVEDLEFGLLTATIQTAAALQFNIDRIVLGLVASPSIVGLYSAATRGVLVALVPINAILRNIVPRFFVLGTAGIVTTSRFAIFMLPKIIIVGLLSGSILLVGATTFAAIMGPGFAGTRVILQLLFLVPMLQGVQYALADALSGADHQFSRTVIGVAGAVAYVAIITVLTVLYGVMGLVVSIYLYQMFMIATCSATLWMLSRREQEIQISSTTGIDRAGAKWRRQIASALGNPGADVSVNSHIFDDRRNAEPYNYKMKEIYLNFHGLGAPPANTDDRQRLYWLDPERFATILRLVRKYEDDNRRIFITFDDGNISDSAIALPILKEFGLRASFFVLSDRIGMSGFLGAEDLLRLHNSGMSIGSHGIAHQKWTTLKDAELKNEINQSVSILSALIGHPVESVAVPFGAYDRRVLYTLANSGIKHVYTSDGGFARPGTWVKPRTTIRIDTPLEVVERILSGQFSLLQRFQLVARGWLAGSLEGNEQFFQG